MNNNRNTLLKNQAMTPSTIASPNKKPKNVKNFLLPLFCCYREQEEETSNDFFNEHSLKNSKHEIVITTNFSIDASLNIDENRKFF